MSISEHIGRISDLPVNNESNFVPNSEKRVVFGPEGRFWSDYVMRCFTFAPHAGIEKVHTHPWPHWMICLNTSLSISSTCPKSLEKHMERRSTTI